MKSTASFPCLDPVGAGRNFGRVSLSLLGSLGAVRLDSTRLGSAWLGLGVARTPPSRAPRLCPPPPSRAPRRAFKLASSAAASLRRLFALSCSAVAGAAAAGRVSARGVKWTLPKLARADLTSVAAPVAASAATSVIEGTIEGTIDGTIEGSSVARVLASSAISLSFARWLSYQEAPKAVPLLTHSSAVERGPSTSGGVAEGPEAADSTGVGGRNMLGEEGEGEEGEEGEGEEGEEGEEGGGA